MKKSYDELDKIYRFTEKQEIQKYKELGKTASDYYRERDGIPSSE